MFRTLLLASATAATLLITGCAGVPQAFVDDGERVTPQSKPVFLMTTTLRNDYHPSFEPRALFIVLEKENPGGKPDHLVFKMDQRSVLAQDDAATGNKYVLRLPLEPGHYDMVQIYAQASHFPIIGQFWTPLHESFDVKPGGAVYYLGHVEASVRERQGDEFRAGLMIPLIDQAVAGASGGTWDVAITDALDVDEPVLRGKFVALNGLVIQKAVLAPFDRARAQAWWVAN